MTNDPKAVPSNEMPEQGAAQVASAPAPWYDNYPFGTSGRAGVRLLFDFATGLGCFKDPGVNRRVLDFACGTGWTSEWLNKIGYEVHAFDCDPAATELVKRRAATDRRIDPTRLFVQVADGHKLPYPDDFFGHTFCFDSLHHMADYPAVFAELFRVLAPGGRCIFMEPGANHSRSPETLAFLAKHQKPDWWIERDVDLIEIRNIAEAAGFNEPRVKPFLLPFQADFSATDWQHILDNPVGQQNFLHEWRRSCWNDRVVFYGDKPE